MANELSLDYVRGIFVVLLAGMGKAYSIAVIEYIWKSRRLEKKTMSATWTWRKKRLLKQAQTCSTSTITHWISMAEGPLTTAIVRYRFMGQV
jgi:hypothetical protein